MPDMCRGVMPPLGGGLTLDRPLGLALRDAETSPSSSGAAKIRAANTGKVPLPVDKTGTDTLKYKHSKLKTKR